MSMWLPQAWRVHRHRRDPAVLAGVSVLAYGTAVLFNGLLLAALVPTARRSLVGRVRVRDRSPPRRVERYCGTSSAAKVARVLPPLQTVGVRPFAGTAYGLADVPAPWGYSIVTTSPTRMVPSWTAFP
jgi:hypothetical protein